MVWGGKFTSLKRYWNFHFSFSKTSLVYLNIIFVIKLCFFVLHCIRIKQISMAAYLLVMGPMPGSYQTETCFISSMRAIYSFMKRCFVYNDQEKRLKYALFWKCPRLPLAFCAPSKKGFHFCSRSKNQALTIFQKY